MIDWVIIRLHINVVSSEGVGITECHMGRGLEGGSHDSFQSWWFRFTTPKFLNDTVQSAALRWIASSWTESE